MLSECEIEEIEVNRMGTSSEETKENVIQEIPSQNFHPQISQENYDTLMALKNKLEIELVSMKKEVEMAQKAKEVTVMRYANSEKEVYRQRKEMENADKQIKNLFKETETLTKKNKMLSTERERLINMVDSKVNELQSTNKEVGRLKDEINAKDFKIKWTQTKLTTETEAHKETQQKLAKCTEDLEMAIAEASKMRTECQDMILSCGTDSTLNPETLITDEVDSQENQSETPLNPFKKEVEVLKQRHRALIDENNSLSCRIQTLQEDRLDMEQRLVRLQESNADHLHQIASLQSDLALADSFKVQLQKDQERLMALQSECEQLRQCNSELLSDMTLCRGKEAELLSYTQKVTEKNVFLQSEFSSTEGKSSILEEENERLRVRIDDLVTEIKGLEKSMSQERKNFQQEKKSLLNKLECQRNDMAALQEKVDEAVGEVLVLKKKHETTFRELTKELQIAMRMGKEGNTSGDGISQSSRTSSSTSLNNMEANQRSKIPESPVEPDAPVIPDQQLLIERIVKLQRMLAKKQDKIEFVQEHNKQLVDAFQRKCKIIQNYAMNQDPGALSTNISDQNKLALGKVISAEVVKHGGIMASIYGSKHSDEGLTLELSLEINRKLQAVLEDTLLKNITLKENINTLGKEISNLIETNRKLVEKSDGMHG